MTIRIILCIFFMCAGLFALIMATVGIFKFKDFYCQLHAIGLGQAVGVTLACIGLIIYEGFSVSGIKIIFIIIASMVAGPIGTHIIDKVAFSEAMETRRKNADNIN